MEAEQAESQRLVETLLVVEIDPSLALFRPTCTHSPMPARVEMGVES
jgi:hypothetical protein